jgi:hypothetical protein
VFLQVPTKSSAAERKSHSKQKVVSDSESENEKSPSDEEVPEVKQVLAVNFFFTKNECD